MINKYILAFVQRFDSSHSLSIRTLHQPILLLYVPNHHRSLTFVPWNHNLRFFPSTHTLNFIPTHNSVMYLCTVLYTDTKMLVTRDSFFFVFWYIFLFLFFLFHLHIVYIYIYVCAGYDLNNANVYYLTSENSVDYYMVWYTVYHYHVCLTLPVTHNTPTQFLRLWVYLCICVHEFMVWG